MVQPIKPPYSLHNAATQPAEVCRAGLMKWLTYADV